MAFNIIAETSKHLDFRAIHKKIFSEELPFDFIPMPGLGIRGGDALGICVPLKNANEESWRKLKPILTMLKADFSCDVYDLYGGQKLELFNMNSFKQNLLA